MSLASTTLHSSAVVRIRRVTCRPDHSGCGDLECTACHSLVLPLGGVFLKHVGGDERIVADRHHALFFSADVPYRISHPAGGDDCLAFDFLGESLDALELVASTPGAVSGAHPRPFAANSERLTAQSIALKHRFAARLKSRLATSLEADEISLQLLSACRSVSSDSARRRPRRAGGTHSRRRIEATLLALSAQPARAWSLAELAREVYSSPWHLARTFRREVGMTLHQFQLLARLSDALDPLLEPAANLSTIAAGLGFSSHSHFTAAFRKVFGRTPSELRREAS